MNQLLSERILNMATSATLAMAAKARELKAEGKDIIGLSLGEPDLTHPISLKTLPKQPLMKIIIPTPQWMDMQN